MIHARECVLQSLQICCIIPRLALRSNSHPALGASLTNLTTSWSVTRSTPTVLICLRIPPPLTHAPPSLLLSELHHSLRSCCHLAEHCRLNRPPSKLVHAADKLLVFRYPLIKSQSTQADSAALFFLVGGAFTEAGKTFHTHTLTWKPRHLPPLVIKWFHSATVMHTVHFH